MMPLRLSVPHRMHQLLVWLLSNSHWPLPRQLLVLFIRKDHSKFQRQPGRTLIGAYEICSRAFLLPLKHLRAVKTAQETNTTMPRGLLQVWLEDSTAEKRHTSKHLPAREDLSKLPGKRRPGKKMRAFRNSSPLFEQTDRDVTLFPTTGSKPHLNFGKAPRSAINEAARDSSTAAPSFEDSDGDAAGPPITGKDPSRLNLGKAPRSATDEAAKDSFTFEQSGNEPAPDDPVFYDTPVGDTIDKTAEETTEETTEECGFQRLGDLLRARGIKSHFDAGGKYRVVNDEDNSHDSNLVDTVHISSDSDSSLTDLSSDGEGSFDQQESIGDDEIEEPSRPRSSSQHQHQRQRQRKHQIPIKFCGVKLTLRDLDKKCASDLAVLVSGARSRPELFRFQCPAPSCGARLVETTVYKDFAKHVLTHKGELYAIGVYQCPFGCPCGFLDAIAQRTHIIKCPRAPLVLGEEAFRPNGKMCG